MFDESRFHVRLRNESDRIKGTLCNGCSSLEVGISRRRFHEEETYYCNKCGSRVDPKTMTKKACERIGEVRTRK